MIVFATVFMIVLGGILLVLEFFFLPGLIAGIIGFVLQVAGVWTSFTYLGNSGGVPTLIGTLLLDAFLFWLVFKSGMWKRISLNTELSGRVNTLDDTPVKVGDTGITISRLAPAGKANINGHLVEVHSANGQFLDEQKPIVVAGVNRGKITVNAA